MDLSGQFGYCQLFLLTHSKTSKVELLTLEVSDDRQLHLRTSTILLFYQVASGEPFCLWTTFLPWYLLSPWLPLVRPGGMNPCPQAPNKRPHTQDASLPSMRLDRRTHRDHGVRLGVTFSFC